MTDDRADLLVGVQAIADFLGYTRRAAQHLIDRDTLPVFRIGSRIHARRTTLNAWLAGAEARAEAERRAAAGVTASTPAELEERYGARGRATLDTGLAGAQRENLAPQRNGGKL